MSEELSNESDLMKVKHVKSVENLKRLNDHLDIGWVYLGKYLEHVFDNGRQEFWFYVGWPSDSKPKTP